MYKGVKHRNETYGMVLEYIERKRLAELGFVSDLSKLPHYKAKAFSLIASEVDRLRQAELKGK